jgi:probable F420-dependent oxidoreductase
MDLDSPLRADWRRPMKARPYERGRHEAECRDGSQEPSNTFATVKIGLFATNFNACADPETAVDVARAAEAAGFESLWTGEHIVLPDPKTPASPLPPNAPMLDTIVSLTWLAAHTTTIRLASGIILLPLRNPLVLAKELASVDVVSGGRLIVGLGTGYLEPEFDAVGVPLARRGERTDDYLRAMRAVWTMDQPAYAGEFVSFSGVDAQPRPIQRPTPPIVIGGGSPAAYRRAVTAGNGWYGFALNVDGTAQCLGSLRAAADRHERPDELGPLEITVSPVGGFNRGFVDRFAELGVDRLVVLPRADASRDDRHAAADRNALLRQIDKIHAEVISASA